MVGINLDGGMERDDGTTQFLGGMGRGGTGNGRVKGLEQVGKPVGNMVGNISHPTQ